MNFICKHCGADHAENTCKNTIKFPCKTKFTIRTYDNTTRTAVFDVKDEEHLKQLIDFYMSDTTGETKSVTHEFYEGKKQP